MANETERVLLTVDFDSAAAEKQAIELRKEIDLLKKAHKDLADSLKTGKITQDEFNKATYENQKAQKAASAELASVNRNVALADKINKAATGSLKQMRAELSVLTDKYTSLSKAERENAEIGGKLQKQIKGISDSLKMTEGALGDNRRSVGDYKNGILDAAREMGVFNGALGQVAETLVNNVTQGITIAKKGFGSFSGFVKLNVVGAIATAASAATAFFKVTGEGEDMLERIKAGATGAFAGISQNLANAAKEFKNADGFFEGIKAFNAFLTSQEAQDNIAKSSKVYLDNVDALQAIEDAERDFRVAVSERRLEIDRLLLTSKDISLSDEQQIENLEKVKKLEVDLSKQEIGFAEVRLKNALRLINSVKDPTDELKEAVAKARIDLNTLKGESALVLQTADNRIAAQKKQQDDDRKAEEKRQQEQARISREGEEARIKYEMSLELDGVKKKYTLLEIEEAKGRLSSLAALHADETAKTKLKRDSLEEQLAVLRKYGKDTTAVEKELADVNFEIAQKKIQKEVELQNAKLKALSEIGNAIGALSGLLSGQNAEATEFSKALAIVQIAINEAVALSQTIASATTAAAAGGPAAPFLQVAYIASGVAGVLSAFLAAKQVLDEAGDVPKPQFYDGGLYDADGGYTEKGNPREEARNLGDKPYTYHKDEYIIPHTVLATSEGSALARAAERLRRMHPSNPSMAGMYNGGPADGGMTARSITAGSNNNTELINGLITAMKGQKLFVTVTDINRGVNNAKVTADKATLGKK